MVHLSNCNVSVCHLCISPVSSSICMMSYVELKYEPLLLLHLIAFGSSVLKDSDCVIEWHSIVTRATVVEVDFRPAYDNYCWIVLSRSSCSYLHLKIGCSNRTC